MFVATIAFFFLVFFNDLIVNTLTKLGLFTKVEEVEVDEKLGNYFSCLTKFQRDSWYLDELQTRKKLGMSTIDDEALESLRTAKSHCKQMKNEYNYEITNNYKYAYAFQFTPIDLRNTEQEHITSDMVK